MRPPVMMACNLKMFLIFVLLKGKIQIAKMTYLNTEVCWIAVILDISNEELKKYYWQNTLECDLWIRLKTPKKFWELWRNMI